MNPVLRMLVTALVKYVQSHPQVVEQLVEAAVNFLLAELNKVNTSANQVSQ